MKKNLAIYIHWPWCKKKCPYCDFNSHVNSSAPEESYVKALISDLKNQKNITGDRKITSIFFGGGTPSLMKPQYIEQIINNINNIYELDENIEITIEANPTSSNINKFSDFKHAGINRLSVGIQSLNQKHLSFLGREHNVEEAKKTINRATKIFNNVSFDLIYGLPNQTLDEWSSQLEYAINTGVQHLSAYQLTIEPNTVFYSQVKKNKWQPMIDDLQADFFEATHEILTTHNFNHYEISNFSLKGYKCRHNYNIWQYSDYIGLGAGAHGRIKTNKNQTISTQNYKIPNKYIHSVEHVKHGFYKKIDINKQEELQERILMGLRTKDGVNASLIEQLNNNLQPLNLFLSLGMLQKSRDKIALTPKGMLFLDSILQEIIIT